MYNVEYKYSCAETGHQLEFIALNYARDFDRISSWMKEEHVAKTWQLDESIDKLKNYLLDALGKKSQKLWLLSINGKISAYAETYFAPNDRLNDYFPVVAGDYGIHLLIGETSQLSKGYSKLIIRGLSDYLFSREKAKRVLIEPDINVKQLSSIENTLGFTKLGQLNLPEKIANLYAITKEQFYHKNPSVITYDDSRLPLLFLHFPSYPNDLQVAKWLTKLNQITKTKMPYVVISTFDDCYQFSQEARKLQMRWFKQNKIILAEYCLAMLRVTTDTEMIQKLNSSAMINGMPFRCIPVASKEEALKQAQMILADNSQIYLAS
jgi:hypothetical protein